MNLKKCNKKSEKKIKKRQKFSPKNEAPIATTFS